MQSPSEEAAPATEEADHHKTASMLREQYAAMHGFPSYLDMHFALLRMPSDEAEHHLRETDLGSTRHILTANNATDNDEAAP
jgi:hypothetical protein